MSPPPPGESRRLFSAENRLAPVGAGLLIAATAWIYAPASRGGWIWDDEAEILHNAALREPGGLAPIWAGRSGPDYFPLKSTAQWMEWRLWGGHVAGYHAVNLALHLLSAFLLWRLLRRLGLGRLGAWLGGFIFALHPLAVESVAWMAEFKNTLSLPPLLLAMGAWVDWEGRADPPGPPGSPVGPAGPPAPPCLGGYLRALLWFLVALLCKTSVVMFPVVLLLYAWWRRGRIGRRDWRAALPFFLLALAFGGVTVAFQRERAIAGIDLHLGGAASRLAAAGAAAGFYFSRGIFPAGWAPIWPLGVIDPPREALFLPWLGLAGALAWLAVRSARSSAARAALLGLGFFFLNLAPILGFIPMAYGRISLVADHLAYLPMAGLAGLLGAAGGRLAILARSRTAAWAALAAGALLLAHWAGESRREAGVFRDGAGFWTYALKRNPQSWTAENNLGKILLTQGRSAEAEPHFRAALRLNPEDAEAHFNLALILTASRRWEESLRQDAAALRIRPNFPEARRGLGNTLLQAGRAEEAVPELEAALRLRPDYAEAHADLGVALASLGRPDSGIEELETALRLQPGSADAHDNLGVTLLRSGRPRAAAAEFRAALRLDPANAGARANLEQAERELGN